MLFIHSSIDGHLYCFHFLAIMSNTALIIHIQIFVWAYIFISLGYIPEAELARSYTSLCLTSCRTARLFSKVTVLFYIPTSGVGGFQFLHMLTNTCYFPCFKYSHPSVLEVVSYCGFDAHFPKRCLTSLKH